MASVLLNYTYIQQTDGRGAWINPPVTSNELLNSFPLCFVCVWIKRRIDFRSVVIWYFIPGTHTQWLSIIWGPVYMVVGDPT